MADQQDEEEPEQLYEKKGTTLQVWSFFGLKSKEEKDSDNVVCWFWSSARSRPPDFSQVMYSRVGFTNFLVH